MFIQVPITLEEFTELMIGTQQDKTFPFTEEGLKGLYVHFLKLEQEHNTQVQIEPITLNVAWTEYANIGVFKKNNFKVGSKTFDSYSQVKDYTTVVEVSNSPIVLVASSEDLDNWIEEQKNEDNS